MNLDELQSARSTERQRDSLQALADSFYADVGTFVGELRTERERAAAAADDPFDSPEVRRLSDDIKTAENTAEAIYERRVGKLVKLASLEAAGMATDNEGLTAEERDLFETLVTRIEDNRTRVLDDVLAGEDAEPTTQTGSDAAESESTDTGENRTPPMDSMDTQNEPADTDAADVMGPDPGTSGNPESDPNNGAATRTDGSGADTARAPSTPEMDGRTPTDTGPADGNDPATQTGNDPATQTDDTQTSNESIQRASENSADGGSGADDTDRTTVRVTRDVGEILGVDERVYELNTDDVVTLPAVNAGPLVERDAAELLDPS